MARQSKKSSFLSASHRARLIQKLKRWRLFLNVEFGVPALLMAGEAITTKHPSWWAAFFAVVLMSRRVFHDGAFPQQEIDSLRKLAKTDPRAKAELSSVMREGLSYKFLVTSSLPFLLGYIVLFAVLVSGIFEMCVPAARPFIQSIIG